MNKLVKLLKKINTDTYNEVSNTDFDIDFINNVPTFQEEYEKGTLRGTILQFHRECCQIAKYKRNYLSITPPEYRKMTVEEASNMLIILYFCNNDDMYGRGTYFYKQYGDRNDKYWQAPYGDKL